MVLKGFVILTIIVGIQSLKPNMDFDVDYYFSSLRSYESCVSEKFCQVYCGNKNSVCISEKCYCVEDRFEDITEESLYYGLRPTVRHHIAHFCPNLEVARTCIRKCMKEGLPAFCGKDHVCYCGHKYKNTDINPKTNAKAMHNQFKDLYTKYFGPDQRIKESTMEELTEV